MTSALGPRPRPQDNDVLSYSRGGPTVLRIVLGAQLRKLRTAKGITREEAGHAIRASHAKISRLELGRVGFKTRDVADLLTLYGVTRPEERTGFLALADQANAPGWWHKFSDLLPTWFELYVGLEEAASIIRTYEIQYLPALVQTEDYAREFVKLGHAGAGEEEIERRIALRMARQKRMTGPDAPRLWALVDEAALRRRLGDRKIMRAQIDRLLELVDVPTITVQVIPFGHGGHAAAGGPFTLLRFTEPELPDVVYMEQLTSALYLDKREETDPYMRVMDRLCVEAATAAESRRFLAALREEI
ncbi:transcriptional regulator [Sphaerisporangium krabiense]|uniref:Transcriptional regulator with XRE-family HTH domain n=1 Tax=Sphaerisporangium krabiense TaxID=763782 RepID=A0A7W8Z0P2_9ACTN|nr:helix-turn-helix transcriptional regulator [Sphaerisporangium krabiense]MBB5625302.1 transcriptional regulator with XRE-family HTH domain [Sphaerisporangium krabiense]GII64184.1 transcriptional regulator [Sphaerisporangium krabiense]